MLSGLAPFHGLRDTDTLYAVVQGERPAIPANARELGISDGLWQLLTKCWNADYSGRPRIDEIHQHLSQEPALELISPPSKISRAPSYESVCESGTQKYGNVSGFKSVCSRAYSCIANIFVTTNKEIPAEGMFGATLWTTVLNASSRGFTVPHAHESCKSCGQH